MADPVDDMIDAEQKRRDKLRQTMPTLSKSGLEGAAPKPADEGETEDANADESLWEKTKRSFGFGTPKKNAGSQKAISDRLKQNQ